MRTLHEKLKEMTHFHLDFRWKAIFNLSFHAGYRTCFQFVSLMVSSGSFCHGDTCLHFHLLKASFLAAPAGGKQQTPASRSSVLLVNGVLPKPNQISFLLLLFAFKVPLCHTGIFYFSFSFLNQRSSPLFSSTSRLYDFHGCIDPTSKKENPTKSNVWAVN